MSSPTAISYHSVIPENNKETYNEFEVVDFICQFPNRKMNLNSVRFEGSLKFKNEAGAELTDQICQMDSLTGGHSLFESIQTFVNGQSIDMIHNYPRMVKMITAASENQSDMNNAHNVCELKAPDNGITNALLQGITPPTDPTVSQRVDPDFSFRPLIALNSGAGTLGYDKTGDMMVTLTLARTFALLHGNDVNSKVTYSIQNLRIRYSSSPMDDNNDPVVLKTKIALKQSVQSSFANVQTRVPAVCTAMTASFQVQANENTAVNNNTDLNKVPSLTQTQFLFNSSTNTLISYILKNDSEVIDRAIGSMLDTGRNALNVQTLANNNGFLLGIDFDDAISLAQKSFSVQLQSSISSLVPMVMYMYFHSFVEL